MENAQNAVHQGSLSTLNWVFEGSSNMAPASGIVQKAAGSQPRHGTIQTRSIQKGSAVPVQRPEGISGALLRAEHVAKTLGLIFVEHCPWPNPH